MTALLNNTLDIFKEWNYDKNKGLLPEDFTKFSNKKVWWKCDKGHEWEAPIARRSSGSGCPYCAGQKVLAGFNDLATTNPELLKEWNYDKNKDLLPENFFKFSNKKVWWICDKGHEWESTVYNRKFGNSCPYCSNRKVLSGYNDLATTNPMLAKEWNYEKNKGLLPEDFTKSSNKKVWWKCSKGHEWESTVYNRSAGYNCPYCSNQKILPGFNDLATTNPELLKEWNYEKNSVKPTEIAAGSGKKVWWKCDKGHEWESTVYNRKHGRQCPTCNKIKNGN